MTLPGTPTPRAARVTALPGTPVSSGVGDGFAWCPRLKSGVGDGPAWYPRLKSGTGYGSAWYPRLKSAAGYGSVSPRSRRGVWWGIEIRSVYNIPLCPPEERVHTEGGNAVRPVTVEVVDDFDAGGQQREVHYDRCCSSKSTAPRGGQSPVSLPTRQLSAVQPYVADQARLELTASERECMERRARVMGVRWGARRPHLSAPRRGTVAP